jgi:hypothetical protein
MFKPWHIGFGSLRLVRLSRWRKDDGAHCGRRAPLLLCAMLRNRGAGFVICDGLCIVTHPPSPLAGGIDMSGGLFRFLFPAAALIFRGGVYPVFDLGHGGRAEPAGFMAVYFTLGSIAQIAICVACRRDVRPGGIVIIYTVAGVAGFVLARPRTGQFPLPWLLGGADVTVGASA